MGTTVNKMPSINLPLTNESGTIHPIWYEFFRSFIAGAVETSGVSTGAGTVTAGDGLTGGGSVGSGTTINVGAGDGIRLTADAVNVDINGQTNSIAAVEDEIMIVDASESSSIRKTSLQSVINLVSTPSSAANAGGSDSQVQYNSSGALAGDSGFTTDGSGSLSVTGDLTVDNLNFNGSTIASDSSAAPITMTVPAGALNQFTITQSGAASSAFNVDVKGLKSSSTLKIISDSDATSTTANAMLSFGTNGTTATWTQGLFDVQDDDYVFAHGTDLNVNQIFTVDRGTDAFTHHTAVTFQAQLGSYLLRKTTASITASTTQSQGQGALTAEINEVSTVANTNDTVTLPTAVAGQQIWVINNGANTLQIFPASSDNLGAGVDTATTLAAGSAAWFIAYDATNYHQLI